MDVPLHIFPKITTVDYGKLSERVGELRVLSTRLIWRIKLTDRMIVMKIGDIQKVIWMVVHRSTHFTFILKDGRTYRFAGFNEENQVVLTKHLNDYDIATQNEESTMRGQPYIPLVSIRVPLTDVTSIEIIGTNDVRLDFHIDNTISGWNNAPKTQVLEFITLSIPDTHVQFGGIVDSTPATAFKEYINSFDCVRLGSEEVPITTFERLIFAQPRGVFDMEFNLQFFGLRMNQIFVTVLYRSIVSIHVLLKPDRQYVEVVICVYPPLEIGFQKYAYLVLQFNASFKLQKGVQLLMSDDLYASKFGDNLPRSYTVKEGLFQYEVVVGILEGLSNIKRSDGGYGYGLNTTSASYPLEDAFYYLPNPPARIMFDDIKYMEIECPNEGLFDLQIVLDTPAADPSSQKNFDNLPRDQLDRLADFLRSKGLEIRGYEDPSSSYRSFTESTGFRYFSKSIKQEIEKEFSGLASQAIRLKMIERWMELPDETKAYYDMMGQGTRD